MRGVSCALIAVVSDKLASAHDVGRFGSGASQVWCPSVQSATIAEAVANPSDRHHKGTQRSGDYAWAGLF